MTQVNFNINMEELTMLVSNSVLDATMKSLAIVIFNTYMEAERDQFIVRIIYKTHYFMGPEADFDKF